MEQKRRKAHNSIDMTGKLYNNWLIIEKDIEGSKGKIAYWKAECLKCNKIYSVHGPNVRNGRSRQCIPCGHVEGHDKQKNQIRTKRTPQQSSYKYLAIQYKKGAVRRGILWSLTEDDVTNIVSKDCHYCGCIPSNKCNPSAHQGILHGDMDEAFIVRNGIDRVDSSKGYTKENVVPCCAECNQAKMDRSVEAFIEHARRLIAHQDKLKAP